MSPATEITSLLYQYAENLDAGRLEETAALFRHATVRNSSGAVLAGEDLRNMWRVNVALYAAGTRRRKHVITNPILEIDEEAGRAKCRSYYTVLEASPGVPLQIVAAGRYQDEFERTGDGWRFSFRNYLTPDLVGDLGEHAKAVPPAPAAEK